MSPRWGVTQTTVRTGDLAADAAAAAELGFGALGVELADVEAIGLAEAKAILRDARLKVSSVAGLPDLLDHSDEARSRRHLALDVAATLGAPGAIAGTGPLGDLPYEQADSFVRSSLADAGAQAASAGCRILIEPMHPIMRGWSYVHSLDHAARLADGIDSVGVVVDTGHLWWDPSLVATFERNVGLVALVQLADVPVDALCALRYERTPLGSGEVPVAALVAAFHNAGYRGTYECEIVMRLPREQRARMLADTVSWLDGMSGQLPEP